MYNIKPTYLPPEKRTTILPVPKPRHIVLVLLWGGFAFMVLAWDISGAGWFLAGAMVVQIWSHMFPIKPERRMDWQAFRKAHQDVEYARYVQSNHRKHEEANQSDPDGKRYAGPPPLPWEQD